MSTHQVFTKGVVVLMIGVVVAVGSLAARSGEVQKGVPKGSKVTDIAGRTVTVKQPVKRIILAEGRLMYEIAALETEDPFKRIVGWVDDLKRSHLDGYDKYKKKYPKIDDIPVFGSLYRAEFSVEQAIALKPDVVIASLSTLERAQEAGLMTQLAAVGIPTVFVDYRLHPLANTIPSTLLLGSLLDKEKRAQEIVDFYQEQVNKVDSRLAKINRPKPKVYIERGFRGPSDCCPSFGRISLGSLIERAGGINIAADLVPGFGTLNPEQVLVANPELMIITGTKWRLGSEDVSFGYLANPEGLREVLKGFADRPGWGALQAVRNHRFHLIWHQFYNSIYHFAALQQFAKWLYPKELKDLDPEASFKEFHDRFLPIDYSGAFWVSLKK